MSKFIVLYGINNIGKSTQREMLVEKIKENNIAAVGIKYPFYGMAPIGPMLNEYLREGNPKQLSACGFQLLHALHRFQVEPYVRSLLEKGCVVAEDYVGTSLAHGIVAGVDKDILIAANAGLKKPDLAILLDGERFADGKEQKHRHESDDSHMDGARRAHLELAEEFGWCVVNANQRVELVSQDIWGIVSEKYL